MTLMLSLLLLLVHIGAAAPTSRLLLRGQAANALARAANNTVKKEFSPQWVHKCDGQVLSFIPGGGYDLLYGNPMAEGQDPGYKGGYVFDYTFNDCDKTQDKMWVVPDGSYVTVQTTSECAMSSSSEDMYNSKSYQEACNSKISISGSYSTFMASAAFSASAEFKSAHEGFSKEKTVTMSSSQYCKTYLGSMKWRVATQQILSDEYIQAVVQSFIAQDFRSFFAQFGTHMTNGVTLGGRAVYSSTFEEHAFQEASSSESNLQAGAKFSYGAAQGGVKASTSKQREQKQFFEDQSSSHRKMYVGGFVEKPFDNMSAYKEAVRKSPSPLQTGLVDHMEIFSSSWETLSEYIPDLDKLIDRYNSSLYEYCIESPFGCSIIQERQKKPGPAIFAWDNMINTPTSGVWIHDKDRAAWPDYGPINNMKDFGFAASVKVSKITLTCADPYHGYVYSYQMEYSDGLKSYIAPRVGTCCDSSTYNKTNLGHNTVTITLSPSQRITQIQTWGIDKYIGHNHPNDFERKNMLGPAIMKIQFCITTPGDSHPDCNHGCGALFGGEKMETWNIPTGYRFMSWNSQYSKLYDKSHSPNIVTAVNAIQWQAFMVMYP